MPIIFLSSTSRFQVGFASLAPRPSTLSAVTQRAARVFSIEKFGQPYSCPRFFDASEDLLRRRRFFVSLFPDVRTDPLVNSIAAR